MLKKGWFIVTLLVVGWFPVLSVAESIHWQSYKNGLSKGKSENKKIFINFYADW